MEKQTKLYIERNFKKIKLLHKSEKTEIWLVSNQGGVLYVLKYMKYTGVPYTELKNIAHRVLPQIIHVAIDDQQTIVVEEYINGQNMNTLVLEHNFLDEELAKNIMIQLCEGLTVLHEANIIHRDIKPSNLILTSNNEVKLIDFDVARLKKVEANGDTRHLGTKGYAPPEQYGFSQTDCRSDIYALGITMKELLGSFYKGNLIKVLDKCTELNPKDRYQSIVEVMRALRNSARPKYYKVLPAVVIIGLIIAAGVAYLYINSEYSKIQTQTQHNMENNKAELNKDSSEEARETSPDKIKPENPIIDVNPEKDFAEQNKIIEFKQIADREKNPAATGELKISVHCAGVEINEWFDDLVVKYPLWELWHKTKERLVHKAVYQEEYIYFPPDTVVEFTIENDTGHDIMNPVLKFWVQWIIIDEVSPDPDGLVERNDEEFIYKKAKVLKAGEKMVGELPLGKAKVKIGTPLPDLGMVFTADKYPRKFVHVLFYPPDEE
jgi:serine/threonine protein kinase